MRIKRELTGSFWEVVIKPKDLGGLGDRCLDSTNLTIFAKR